MPKKLKLTNSYLRGYLTKNRIRTAFERNLNDPKCINGDELFKEKVNTESNCFAITNAFMWSTTPEGSKFWENHYNDYYNYHLDNYKKD